jgi:CHAD domain-containing protein
MLEFLKPWSKGKIRRRLAEDLQCFLDSTEEFREITLRRTALRQEKHREMLRSCDEAAERAFASEYAKLKALQATKQYQIQIAALRTDFQVVLQSLDDRVSRDALAARFAKAHRRLQRQIGSAGDKHRLSHRLRIRVKRLRYAMEGLAERRDSRAVETITQLRTLQHALGDRRDCTRHAQWLRETLHARRKKVRRLNPANATALRRATKIGLQVAAQFAS